MPIPYDRGYWQGLKSTLEDHAPSALTPKVRQYLDALIETPKIAQVSADLGVKANSIVTRLKAPREIAAQHGYAPNADLNTTIPPGFVAKGLSRYRNEDGVITAQWEKLSAKQLYREAAVEALIASFEERASKAATKPRAAPKKRTPPAEGLLSAYMLGDPHFGALAWAQECGDNWDTNIAANTHKQALEYLINQAPPSEVGLLVNLGDAFHADGVKPVTVESGHLLDTDSRLGYTIDALVDTFTFAIERMLDRHGEAWVINVRGNHDPSMALAFNRIIKAYYRKDDRVTVIDNTAKLINLVWGKTLLSFHHTDRLNFKRWYEMLTRDFGSLWGQSDHRYGHGGHVHHKQVQEVGGMMFHTWPTLAAADAWHAASGYGAGRSATVVTYCKQFGEVESRTCNIDRVRALQAAA